MEFKLQEVSCSCCGNNDPAIIITKQGFRIVRCKSCRFVYVNPRVADEQLKDIYSHNYFSNKDYGYVSYDQEKRLRVRNFERWLNDVITFLPSTGEIRVLDVGCAAGYCLEVMKAKGWNTAGLELDSELSEMLNKKGFPVHEVPLEDFNSGIKFSLITLFDVIEHIPEPDKAFRQLHALLDDNGVVLMVTPDHNSFQRKLFGKRWFQYKPVEHIQYFTKDSIKIFAERNGLKLIHYASCGQYADAGFIVNRLRYYNFTFFSKLIDGILSLVGLKNKLFYTDTGSLYAVFKKL